MELESAKPIGLDMQGNIIRVGDVEFPQQDKKIRKGDKFECIQHVVMYDGVVAYVKGKKYASEIDGCITDDEHDEKHEWTTQEDGKDNWWEYFKRI